MTTKTDDDAYHKIRIPARTKPAGCPVDHDFTTFTEEYLDNPYPGLAKLREENPIFYSEKLGYLVVTRMEDVTDIFSDHAIYSSENVQDPVFPVCDRAAAVLAAEDFNPVAVMSNKQQPDHTRIKKYTRLGFSGRRMKLLEPYVRKRSQELVDAMISKGKTAEFVSAFGHPLPGQTIFRFIGFDETDDDQLISWTSNRLAFTWGNPNDDEQVDIAENMLRYWRYCREFVAKRHKQRAVSNSLLCLLPRREDWSALCNDSSLIPNALEEVLRFESPQTSWRRVTNEDTQIGDVIIPAGTQVFLSLAAANHEPELFESASTFDINRKNARKHISFGHGIHFCLGARLARLEGEIAIETLTNRLPTLRLVKDQQLVYSPNITFRGPMQLQVEWD